MDSLPCITMVKCIKKQEKMNCISGYYLKRYMYYSKEIANG